jgi:hypothetical protein
VRELNINSTIAALTDELSEYVGLKSGLAITSNDVVRLLDRNLASEDDSRWYYSPHDWLHERPEAWVRLRAEEMESLVVRLMYLVGALPTPLNQIQLLWHFAREHPEVVNAIPPSPDEDDFPLPVTPFVRFSWYAAAGAEGEHTSSELAALLKDYERRSILDLMVRTERADWDGATPLRDLFEIGELNDGAVAGDQSPPLIDQRFIDYLNAQPDDLSRMHWRQFEFLVGEFFRRVGYQVHVTPPSGDGGVDIRAIRMDETVGPELVLIQAKRYREDRHVGIEAVKALWSDVDEASATRGLVATTSALAPGARAYCQARRYRLTAAERPTVESWLRALATYPR